MSLSILCLSFARVSRYISNGSSRFPPVPSAFLYRERKGIPGNNGFCLFTVGMAVLMFFLFGKPYKRGFFCNDESLYHPFHSSTITSPMLYVIGFLLPISTVSQLPANRRIRDRRRPSVPRSSAARAVSRRTGNPRAACEESLPIHGIGAVSSAKEERVAPDEIRGARIVE